ncbi:MAG: carotenoid oxygenase family protein [Aphanocapsa sp. GSE-SYN-MK-11-07L]|jgi:carotenoid cleavage dioxygenase-like enzyme|nr:carotenoid oxygenase family protein [Aphanocapsa sp. GSE-SYN-MK-11-07L]
MSAVVGLKKSSQLPLWARAIAEPAQEYGPTPLQLIAGQIPPGLRGSLYRNGPARLERAGQRVPHWFDGDGGILAVHFGDAGATGLYRYVQTAGLVAESKANRYLYSGYGQLAAGPIWQRWGSHPKNAANTSVLALPDKLLALWEGGLPHRLDLENLETQGLDQLGALLPKQAYSAHPKRDPKTGDIYNFGLEYGKEIALNLFRSDASGQIRQQASLPLERFSLVHDFAIAGPYLIFLIPPLQMHVLPLLLGIKSFSDGFQWRPSLGTQVLIIDRETFQPVTTFEVDPWFQWHIGNGYVELDRTVVIDFVRYADWATNQWLAEVVTGSPRTESKGYLWRIRLDIQQKKLLESQQITDCNCDFPLVDQTRVGQLASSLYLLSDSDPKAPVQEMFDSIARVDLATGTVSKASLGPGSYPMEPIPVSDRLNPDQTWLLTIVFDGQQAQSSVQIFDAHHLESGPVCVLALPQIIPFGFHGTWRSV